MLALVLGACATTPQIVRPQREPTLVDCRMIFSNPEDSHVRTRACEWRPVHRHLIRLTDDAWIVLAPPGT